MGYSPVALYARRMERLEQRLEALLCDLDGIACPLVELARRLRADEHEVAAAAGALLARQRAGLACLY